MTIGSRSTRWCLAVVLLTLVLGRHGARAWPVNERDLAVAEQAASLPQEGVVAVLTPEVFGPELAERGDRDKRALEAVVVKTFGITNYVLGLLFGKINQAIDHKTQLVKTLDRFNVQKNEAFGITGKSQPCHPVG